MSLSDQLFKATINRLSARLSEKMMTIASKISILAEEAPEKIRKEWEIFQEEVQEEAERLNNDAPSNQKDVNYSAEDTKNNTQETIDRIRFKISNLENQEKNQIK